MRWADYEFQINGKPMPAADAGVEIRVTDLESKDSGRDEGGFFHRILVRQGMRSWRFVYEVLSTDEYAYLLSLLKSGPSFAFAFTGLNGQPDACVAYCKEITGALYDRNTGIYKNMKFTIEEC